MVTDMTVGKPDKVLFKFIVPMLISVIFQQMYNIADGMIAGKYAGVDALASVGASYPITMIFMAIAIGCNIGCSVVISNLFGAKEYKKLKTAISTTLITCLVVSIVLTVLGLVFCTTMLNMINTPQNIFSDSLIYLQIFIAGLIFLFFYNICTGIFTALGDSKTPLYLLIISSIGNIILDYIFVKIYHKGVVGVAIATLIAQGFSCILGLILLKIKVSSIKCDERHEIFSMDMLKNISTIAVPSVLQQSFISVGNIFIQFLVNGYNSDVIAGYTSAIKLNTFAVMCLVTLGNAISNFTAQNIGAKEYDRIRCGYRAACKIVICVVVPFIILYFFFTTQLVGFFMEDGGSKALQVGVDFLKIVSPFYIVISIKLLSDGVLRGAGEMRKFMIATFLDLVLRVILAFILSDYYGTNGIWISWPIGWGISAVLSFTFYKVILKNYNKKLAKS